MVVKPFGVTVHAIEILVEVRRGVDFKLVVTQVVGGLKCNSGQTELACGAGTGSVSAVLDGAESLQQQFDGVRKTRI